MDFTDPMFYVYLVVMLYVGIPILFFIPLFVAGPLVAKSLVNRPFYQYGPDEKDVIKSTFGFFTEVEPGQVKIVERGGRFIRCIMRYPGHTFRGYVVPELHQNTAEYWDVINTPDDCSDARAIHRKWRRYKFIYLPYHLLWYRWKIWVYTTTGTIFTGIAPWQTVRVYPIEYFREKTTDTGEFELERKKNFSDHFRAGNSDFFVAIGSADTLDKVPVKIVIGMVLRIQNPWVAAYDNDQGWTARLYATIPSQVNDVTRNLPLDQVISGSNQDITNRVVELGREAAPGIAEGPLVKYGIVIEQATTPDRSVLPQDKMSTTQQQLAAVALARVAAAARKISAAAEANAALQMTRVMKAGGDHARFAAEIERDVRVAQAAGDRAIISIGGGGREDNKFLAAILATLKGGRP